MDDWNIETIKDPYLHYFTTKDPYFLSLLNTITSLLYSEQLGLERHTIKCNYSL